MNALVEFDEKEFWIQLFSIITRREERTEGEDVDLYSNDESQPQRVFVDRSPCSVGRNLSPALTAVRHVPVS